VVRPEIGSARAPWTRLGGRLIAETTHYPEFAVSRQGDLGDPMTAVSFPVSFSA
jgi:hypothetical protein